LDQFGRGVRIASVVIIVFFAFYMASIYKGAGNLLEVMLGISYAHGLIITAVIVTSLCGFRAVVYTDLIQGVLTFIGGIVLFFAFPLIFVITLVIGNAVFSTLKKFRNSVLKTLKILDMCVDFTTIKYSVLFVSLSPL